MLEFEREMLMGFIPNTPLDILDLGCGFGELSSSLIRDSQDFVMGVDFQRYSPNKYENLPNAEFVHSELQAFETERMFDVVLLFGVVTHLDLVEEIELYKKVKSLLNQGGLFLVKNQCAFDQEKVVNTFSEKLEIDYSGRYPKLEDQQLRLSRLFDVISTNQYPDDFQEHEDTKHILFTCKK